MSDNFIQQILRASRDQSIPTPFGWLPMSALRSIADTASSPAGVQGISQGLGAPIDAASWLWRNTDFNSPETRDRIYRSPPVLGSDHIRGLLGGDPTPTPGQSWINDDGSMGPALGASLNNAAAPGAPVFGGLAPSSWPPVFRTALRRVIR
jgi:hypothetical protein